MTKHFAGYHGTSIYAARTIERDGFLNMGEPICFAPLNNLFFAMRHGRERARENGDSQYAVILANFPGQELSQGVDAQIEVPPEDIGNIAVRNVMLFETRPSGLQVPVRQELPSSGEPQ